jgi:Zn-dependent protease
MNPFPHCRACQHSTAHGKTEAGTLEADGPVCYNPGDDGALLPSKRLAGNAEDERSITLLSLYRTDPVTLVAILIAMLVGLTVHEASHAWVAYRLGDDTAKRAGRLTLNPLRHLDPLGALMVLLVGFGWAKPVPVSPWQLRHGPRVGMALVAAAGPFSNLVIAATAAVLWRLGIFRGTPDFVELLIWVMVLLNVSLLLFNLIPLAPLDGSSVLNGVIGGRAAAALAPLQRYGPMILIGLIVIGSFVPQLDVFGQILGPLREGLMQLLMGA